MILKLLPIFLSLPSLAQKSQLFANDPIDECQVEAEEWAEDFPHTTGPLVSCKSLNEEWFECEDVAQLTADNTTTKV
jgi:hypothetical protein